MQIILSILVISGLMCLIAADAFHVTKISKRSNPLLSRKKRYLTFPAGSNFVMTFSAVKSIMQTQPKGYNMLGECDVPFALPSDTRLFRNYRRNHYLQRRDVYSQLETALSGSGLNGNACVKRMICDAQRHILMERKSLLTDLLSAIFLLPEVDLDSRYQDSCHESTFTDCTIPLLRFIVGSVSGFYT